MPAKARNENMDKVVMDSEWISEFILKKAAVAKSLNEGECGGTYAEAAIIFSSIISGIASEAWPGRNIDQFRFVETCVKFTSANAPINKISIPLLIEDLYTKGDMNAVKVIKKRFQKAFSQFPGTDALVITGEDVDLSEDEALAEITTDRKLLRESSYANLFYKEVRCAYAHEYQLGKRASYPSMTRRSADVSYINRLDADTNRLIHFSFNWMENLVLSIVNYFKENPQDFPLSKPSQWWLES